jgi:hypothetical protein
MLMNLPLSSSRSTREPDYLQFRAVDCARHSCLAETIHDILDYFREEAAHTPRST